MLKQLRGKNQGDFKNINSKNGIGLIVLLITLVIMLIIAMTVILTYKDNQISKDANYAVLKNDMEVMADKFTLTYGNKLKSVGYDKTKITNSDFDTVIPEEYKDRFEATTNGIIYLGSDQKIIEIAKDLNIKVGENQDVIADVEFNVSAKTDRISINIIDSKTASNVKYKYIITEDTEPFTTFEETIPSGIYTKVGLKKGTVYKVDVYEISSIGTQIKLNGITEITTGNIEAPSFEQLNNDWTKGPVNVTINYFATEGVKNEFSYTGKQGEFTETKNTQENLKIVQNTSIFARSIDEFGNVSEVKELKITNIDNESPKLFIPEIISDVDKIIVSGNTIDEPATLTNGSSGIKSYGFSIDNGQTFVTSDTNTSHTFNNLEKDREYIIKMKVIDNARNQIITDPITVKTIKIEKPGINLSNYYYINQDITAKITYSEIEGTTKQYSFDSINWQNYTAPLTITKNTTIYARLINALGQKSEYSTLVVNKIDKIVPNSFTPSVVLGVDNITVNASTTDGNSTSEYAKSGIKHYQFSIDNGTTWTAKQEATGYLFRNLSKNTSYNVKVKAIDVAGNETISQTLVAKTGDVVNPAKSISFDVAPNVWTNQVVKVNVIWSDISAEFARQVSFDAINWQSYTEPLSVINNNTTVYARVLDGLGNNILSSSIKIANIDRLPPDSLTINPNNSTDVKSISVNVSSTDTIATDINGFSDIDEIKCIWDTNSAQIDSNSPLWKDAQIIANNGVTVKDKVTGDYYLHIRSKDKAGNFKTATSGLYVIDNTPPPMPQIQGPNPSLVNIATPLKSATWEIVSTDGDITVEETKITKTGSGVISGEINVSGNGTKNVSITIDGISGNGNLGIKLSEGSIAKDRAGNETILDLTGSDLVVDTVAPIVQSLNVISPETGYYSAGGKVLIEATFSEDIKGTPPVLKYKFGTGVVKTATNPVINKDKITYEVNIVAGDNGQFTLDSYIGNSILDLHDNVGNIDFNVLGGNIITADTLKPSITSVTMTSSNANPLYAKNLDTVTVFMTFSENIIIDPIVTISGRSAQVSGTGNTRAATYTIPVDESILTQGALSLNISGYKDVANNVGDVVTSVTTGSPVIYDREVNNVGTMILKQGSVAGANYTNDTWINQNVYLEKVNGTDDLSGHKTTTYGVSGANTVAPGTITPTTLTNEGISTIVVTTTDIVGNVSTRTYTVKIDKTLPTTTISPNGGEYTIPTGGSVATIKATLTAADTGGSGIATVQYAWSAVNVTTEPATGWTNYTAAGQEVSKTDAAVGTYYLWTKVIDNATNRATSVQRSNGFIVKANTDVANRITLTPSMTGWTNGNVNVTITYGSALTQNRKYGIGSANTNATSSPATQVLTANGTVYAEATDIAGNKVTATLQITNIDKILPTATMLPNEGDYIIPTGGSVATIKATLTAADTGGSGLGTVQYAWSALNVTTEPTTGWTNYTATGQEVTKTNAAVGTYYLWTKVIDTAGNRATTIQKSNAFIVRANTEATSKITLTPSVTAWTNGNVNVTVTYGTVISQNRKYGIGSATTSATSNPATQVVTSNGTVYAEATDIAGNKITATLQITNIDKTLPQNATYSLSTNSNYINGNISISDNESGISTSNSKYIITTQSSAYGINDSIWNSATVMNTTSKTISESRTDGTYYVQTLSVDNVGNKRVNVSNALTVVSAVLRSTTLYFSSTSQSQSQSTILPNLISVQNISTNNGSVGYYLSGNQINVNVSSGSGTTGSNSMYASTTVGPQASSSFNPTRSYSSGSYSGTLSFTGSTQNTTTTPTTTQVWNSTKYSKTYQTCVTYNVTTNPYPSVPSSYYVSNSGGYSGSIPKDRQYVANNGVPTPQWPNGWDILYVWYAGTIYKGGYDSVTTNVTTTTYTGNYSGWIYSSYTYYPYTVTISYLSSQ